MVLYPNGTIGQSSLWQNRDDTMTGAICWCGPLTFANQANLDQVGLAEHARKVGLDMDLFSGCVASRKFESAVESDFQSGLKAGVSGTPAFYINGVFLSGAQPASAIEKIIKSELQVPETKSAGQ
jgi:predicted DsbA family dithiol-disulfide isomerase